MRLALFLAFFFAPLLAVRADTHSLPKHVNNTLDFRDLLLATKWSWRNVSANVPDRECVFEDDGTFRHPHFTARFAVKDMSVVELVRRDGKKCVLTFNKDYTSFEAIDFEKHRITGSRLGVRN